MPLRGGHKADEEGTAVLRDRVSAQGDCAGGDRRDAAGDGPALRKSGAFRRRAGHFAHRAAGGNRHGRNGRQTAAKISWSFRTE